MRNNSYSTITIGLKSETGLSNEEKIKHTPTCTHNCKSRMLFLQDDFNPDFRMEKNKVGRSARNTGMQMRWTDSLKRLLIWQGSRLTQKVLGFYCLQVEREVTANVINYLWLW